MLLSKFFLFQFNRVLEGGLAAAAVLISLGALLGKLNPFQILMLSIIEAPIFVFNSYLGYTILGVADVGNVSRFASLQVLLSSFLERARLIQCHQIMLF